MGVIVKPKNLNDRQMKRVDRIEESNPLRARTVASRISERRDARGAENPQIAKAIAERRSIAQAMKKGGKMTKTAKPKMKAGGMLKRADGSYSKRGLWDNIRANKGSGKKPTAAMLKQERKIKSKTKK